MRRAARTLSAGAVAASCAGNAVRALGASRAAGGLGGPGTGGGAGPSTTLNTMDAMAQRAAKGRSEHWEEVQAQRRQTLHRERDERRQALERAAKKRAPKSPQQGRTAATAQQWTAPNDRADAPAGDIGGADGGEAVRKGPTSAFAAKLGAMHADMSAARKATRSVAKVEAKEKVVKEERRKLLRFRDVDEELDQLILKRDLFLWVSTLRKGGKENVIDQMLERELRYYPDESNSEVRYNPKLFVGLPRLSGNGQPFPTLQQLTRLSSLPIMEETRRNEEEAAADGVAGAGSERLDSIENRVVGRDVSTARQRARLLLTGIGDEKGGVMVSRAHFPRPTLVTLSQLTVNMSVQQYEDQWIALLRPELDVESRLKDEVDADSQAKRGDAEAADESSDAKSAAKKGATAAARKPKTAAAAKRPRLFNADSFNVVRLKSIESRAARWIKPLLVSNYTRGMSFGTAKETLVGERLVRHFMEPLALRNFSTTYCFLVDSRGHVRWMSSGAPTPEEKAAFPELLRELELEYVRRR